MGGARHLEAGSERFTGTGLNGPLGALVSFGGAAGFLVVTGIVLSQGIPTALFAVLPGFFGFLLLVGGLATLARGDDPTVIEVGSEGVWLPGLGARRWSEFRDIRVERATGPAGHGTTTYRRLGFVPRDPRPAQRRPFVERLAFDMTTAFYRFTSTLMANRPVDVAPFGVQEAEIGSPAFERLLALVGSHVPLGHADESRTGASATGPTGTVPRGPAAAPGFRADSLAATVMPAMTAGAAGFFLVAIAGIVQGPGWRGADAGPFVVAFVALFALLIGASIVRAGRRARAAGAGLLPLVIVVLASAAAGALAAAVLGFGPG